VDKPGFEEKQYDNALQQELADGLPRCYPSAPVIEGILAYDFAIDPGDRRIWDILGLSRPSGLVLTPDLWAGGKQQPPPDRLPSRVVSLIIQAKRAVGLNHWRAGQYDYWRGPYFRFGLDTGQQRILEGVEQRATPRAVIRYAAPAFTAWADFERHYETQNLAAMSTFVSPLRLTGHSVWTYSGPGLAGYANPEGEEIETDSSETMLEAALEAASEPPRDHILALGQTLDELMETLRFDVPRSRRPLRRVGDRQWPTLPDGANAFVRAWLAISYVVAWAGASWMLVDVGGLNDTSAHPSSGDS
jgi:hypothetical protein